MENKSVAGTDIRCVLADGKEWYAAIDVARLLSIHNGHSAVRNHVPDGHKRIIKTPTAGGNQGICYIDNEGLANIALLTNTGSSVEKEKIISQLKLQGMFADDVRIVKTSKELDFLGSLEECLAAAGLCCGIKQYPVSKYRIDYYFPEYKLAVEYDENDHRWYTFDRQEGRQSEIEQMLGCKFVRLNADKTNAYNIGVVLNEILKGA